MNHSIFKSPIRFFIVWTFVIHAGYAAFIYVPDSVPTIQEAIQQASEGDTILVAPGRYEENIHIQNKSIVLASTYLIDHDPVHVLQTIIDGSSSSHPDSGSVVFIEGESSTQVIGFTLTGGSGTVWQDREFGHSYREGGGVFVLDASPVIKQNYIVHNSATDTVGMMSTGGGGVACEYADVQLANNVIKYNEGRFGAGVVLSFSSATVNNNIIAGNVGGQDFGGGGLWFYKTYDILVVNNTIVGNHVVDEGTHYDLGAGAGGAYVLWVGNIAMVNNIIWDNTQSAGNTPVHFQVSTQIEYSHNNIQDHYAWDPKVNNISEPPLFQDSTFVLSDMSPCIDAGHVGKIYRDPESSGEEAAFPAKGSITNDLGAYGGPESNDLLGVSVETLVRNPLELTEFGLYPNFPNPFNNSTQLMFSLPAKKYVRLTVYDVLGRKVTTLINGPMSAGFHRAQFDGTNLATGHYIAKLEWDTHTVEQTLLLVK